VLGPMLRSRCGRLRVCLEGYEIDCLIQAALDSLAVRFGYMVNRRSTPRSKPKGLDISL